MRKPIEFEFNNQTYYLLINAAAMFDFYDKFGRGDVLSRIAGNSRAALADIAYVLAVLSQQGELLRRYLGEDHKEILTAEEVLRTMSPADFTRARMAVLEAYKAGLARETGNDNDEVDVGLLKLQKKTGPACRGHGILAGLRRFFTYRFGSHSC